MGSERRSLLDVMKKLPGRRWKGLRVFASHTNLPGGRWRQFPFGQTIGCAFEKEFRQNADPQTALYHGHNGVVILRGIGDSGIAKGFAKDFSGLIVQGVRTEDVWRLLQCFHREGVFFRGLVLGENRQDTFLQQKGTFKVTVGWQTEKTKVDAALAKPSLNILVTALKKLKRNVGMPLGKGVKQVRKNMHGNTEEGADAHLSNL